MNRENWGFKYTEEIINGTENRCETKETNKWWENGKKEHYNKTKRVTSRLIGSVVICNSSGLILQFWP